MPKCDSSMVCSGLGGLWLTPLTHVDPRALLGLLTVSLAQPSCDTTLHDGTTGKVNEETVERLVVQYPHIVFSVDCETAGLQRTLERAYQMGWNPNTSTAL